MSVRITITPDLETKSAKVAGSMSGGERPTVRLVGCAPLLTRDLRLRVLYAGVTLAVFPLADTDAFAVDGDDLTCALNLNTIRMLNALRASGGGELDGELVLDDIGEARTLYFSVKKSIGAWVLGLGEGTPANLDDYRSAKQLNDRIDDIVNAMDGETLSAEPSQREIAEATKKMWRTFGGRVAGQEQS